MKGGAKLACWMASERSVMVLSGFRLTREAVEKGAWHTEMGASSRPEPGLVSRAAVYEGQVKPRRAASLAGVSTASVTAPLAHPVPGMPRLAPLLLLLPRFQAQPLLTGLHQLMGSTRTPAISQAMGQGRY